MGQNSILPPLISAERFDEVIEEFKRHLGPSNVICDKEGLQSTIPPSIVACQIILLMF